MKILLDVSSRMSHDTLIIIYTAVLDISLMERDTVPFSVTVVHTMHDICMLRLCSDNLLLAHPVELKNIAFPSNIVQHTHKH